MSKKYVVFVGRKAGVYNTWSECEEQVKGFRGAMFKSFPEEEAELEFKRFKRNGHEGGKVNIKYGKPIIGICSDCAYSSKTNVVSYRIVNIKDNSEIMRVDFKDFKTKHLTNIGEFFGLVRAIKYAVDRKLDLPIYCDSRVAIEWVEKKNVNTTITEKEIIFLVNAGVMYLKTLKNVPPVFKWQTDIWGEIPADFGNKKKSPKK